MLFLGTFDYAMDERGRLPLPPCYRDAFRDGIVLSQGSPDRCLRVHTPAGFDEQALEFTALTTMHRKGRGLRRALFPRAQRLELDKQHRILVPSNMRQHARLSGKVVVAGMGEFLEIWAPELFDQELAAIDLQLESMLESVELRTP